MIINSISQGSLAYICKTTKTKKRQRLIIEKYKVSFFFWGCRPALPLKNWTFSIIRFYNQPRHHKIAASDKFEKKKLQWMKIMVIKKICDFALLNPFLIWNCSRWRVDPQILDTFKLKELPKLGSWPLCLSYDGL